MRQWAESRGRWTKPCDSIGVGANGGSPGFSVRIGGGRWTERAEAEDGGSSLPAENIEPASHDGR